MAWKNDYQNKFTSLADAVTKIKSEDKIWAGGYLSVPVEFLKELDKVALNLDNCDLYSGLLTYPYEFLKPEYINHLKYRSFFMGPLEKKFQKHGNAEIITYHLSNIGDIVGAIDFDVMVVEVTPPNEDGYMSLGACGGMANRRIIQKGVKTVIAVVNEEQPFVGNEENLIHVDQVNFICEGSHPIAGPKPGAPTELEISIAEHVLPYISNGSTIQVGIGGLADAVGMGLKGHKDLGIHTEMFTESMMEMCKSGAVSGDKKNYNPNKIITAFAAGSKELMEFISHNDDIEIRDVVVVNNPVEIAKNDNFVSINTCIMCDITGQVASEGVGHTQISGSGGQVDFVRGATMSKGGISIMTLPSTYMGKDGAEPTLKIALPPGTPVTTLRNDVQIIATEYGSVDLRGLTTVERAKALINISHPDFREQLMKEAIACGKVK